jgi:hypothetical protein
VTPIKVGDRVAYTRKFCRNIGAYTGTIPFARGTVENIQGTIARNDDMLIATVSWEGAAANECPIFSNAYNLIREDELHLEPS